MILNRAILLYISYHVCCTEKEYQVFGLLYSTPLLIPAAALFRTQSESDSPENNRRTIVLFMHFLSCALTCTPYMLWVQGQGGAKIVDSTGYPGSGTSQCAVGSGGAIKFARRQVEIFVTVSQKEGLSPPSFWHPSLGFLHVYICYSFNWKTDFFRYGSIR